MKIMVFLQGTVTMHKSGIGQTPAQRVQQSKGRDPSIHQYEDYVPVGDAVQKLAAWQHQGAEIVYLSANRSEKDIQKDISVLGKYNFPDAPVLYRHGKETYADIAERVMPDILIEDDCESIGGEVEMTYPHISPEKQRIIKSIVVPEFSGIDNLPDNLGDLKSFGVPQSFPG